MRLETKVTVIKKSSYNLFLGTDDREEKKKVTHHIVQSLEVTLSENCRFLVYLQRPITFQKFGRTAERIIREINKNISSITFLQHASDLMAWSTYSYDFDEITYVFYLGSADLERIKFSGEQRKIVKRALDGNLKILYTRNPSKPKSDMEYRKRAYYGKCKK